MHYWEGVSALRGMYSNSSKETEERDGTREGLRGSRRGLGHNEMESPPPLVREMFTKKLRVFQVR